ELDALADEQHDLALVVEGLLGEGHGLGVDPPHRRGRLEEHDRLRRERVAELARVRGVVATDAPDGAHAARDTALQPYLRHVSSRRPRYHVATIAGPPAVISRRTASP